MTMKYNDECNCNAFHSSVTVAAVRSFKELQRTVLFCVTCPAARIQALCYRQCPSHYSYRSQVLQNAQGDSTVQVSDNQTLQCVMI
jgi:hypothetical protein